MTYAKSEAGCSSVPLDPPFERRYEPEQTGVGDWCAPGPAEEQRRKWMLVFEDRDMGQNLYDDESEARDAFARAEGRGWNCHLFAHVPRVSPNAAHQG